MTYYHLPPDAVTTHSGSTWVRNERTVLDIIFEAQPTALILGALLRNKGWEQRDGEWFKTYEDPAGDYEIGPYHAVSAIEMQFNEEQPA